ncbi:MAG: ABC transporter substrate-binding protein [Spirochaetales bacterium]
MKIFAVLLACFVLLVGCSSNQTPIRIGIDDWPPCAVWSVAEKEGYLAGLRVEFIHYTNWSDNMEALYKGKVDLTHSTYLNSIFYNSKGEPCQILLSLDTILGGDGLVMSNRLASPKDLVGARVAVEVDTDEHFLLYKALVAFGIPTDQVTLVSATSQEAAKLFAEGKVDACFTYDPYLTEAANSGQGRIVWTTKDAPGYMIDVLVARKELVDQRKGDTTKVVEAWYKALAFIRAHSDVAYPIMAESLKMPLADFVPFFESFQFFGVEENQKIFASPQFQATLGEMSDFLLREKAIPIPAVVSRLYEPSVVGAISPTP